MTSVLPDDVHTKFMPRASKIYDKFMPKLKISCNVLATRLKIVLFIFKPLHIHSQTQMFLHANVITKVHAYIKKFMKVPRHK